MIQTVNIQTWQYAWGSPLGFFVSDWTRFQVIFLLAVSVHAIPFGFLWKYKMEKKVEHIIELQNVDLITPETEVPPAPPMEVQKPKSAFEFLKMAIPIFRKPAAPQMREIAPIRPQEPKIAEPEKLLEKKFENQQAAPEIKLDKSMTAPKIADISKIPTQRSQVPITKDPSLKLEEVGRRAVQIPQTPAISLDRSARKERVADISGIPRQSLAPRSPSSGEKLVERTPAGYAKPSAAPLGYQPRGASFSLDQPREVVRTAPKPVLEAALPKPKTEAKAAITISKEKVKITGPLSSRKAVKSYVPEYPAWARAQNLEADVAIRFTVSPAGQVLENAVVERTSGYPELDKLCLQALQQWKFSPLSGSGQDQWGVITFRFRLD